MGAVLNPFTGKIDFTGGTSSTSPFVINGNTLELWHNSVLVQSWTVTPVVADLTGQPWGLLLAITHPS